MNNTDIPARHKAALELLCVVIHHDKHLRAWFKGLITCPENLRTSTLLQMTTAMRRNEEDDRLIDAVSALCDPTLFVAVQSAVNSLD